MGKWLEGQKHGRGEYVHVPLSQLPLSQPNESASSSQHVEGEKSSSGKEAKDLNAQHLDDATTFEPAEEPTAGGGAAETTAESSSEADDEPADLPQSGGSRRSNDDAAAGSSQKAGLAIKATGASLPVEASQHQQEKEQQQHHHETAEKKRTNPRAVAESKAAQAHGLAAQSTEV